ncbi:hypothetical protein A676_03496 [Salmonella enterica subsp. enterica serovar Enteritidis str. 2010K-0262]|uniref:Uncharacterized protein n=1 Tax=Salmonella enteritidis (strain 2009K0958) TaxID=1192586 RepID=A0A656IMS2_SALE2|nr:hypothetical protein A673_00760 [Salmonella enterica subsp. enterica serovar Enteritidis str. 2009K0958]EPI77999.1 hypothetical protein A672_00025 [Salmonella enterica subsp. enterica serovar Enteritidis str. 08-1080]EPI80659.1 hypothetical protein A676_03496 [Salmonella enterica subsp. enterica serovar Enteritidis str. 2010K-0262]EPI84865.1 hypothetical protein A674_03413 [Salmonella enterica subsp. enterica serovar Enteritidis str. 2009K1651]EPI85514.1 hypothetical protein A675_02457 [Salm
MLAEYRVIFRVFRFNTHNAIIFHDNLKRASAATVDQTGAVPDGFAVGILRYRGILRLGSGSKRQRNRLA